MGYKLQVPIMLKIYYSYQKDIISQPLSHLSTFVKELWPEGKFLTGSGSGSV